MGLAIVAMSINLVQEEIVEKIREFARDVGLVDDEDDESVPIQNDILHYSAWGARDFCKDFQPIVQAITMQLLQSSFSSL